MAHLKLFLDANDKLELDNLGPEEAERAQAAAHKNALFNFLEHTVGHAQVTPRADTNSAGKSSGDQVTMEQENGLNKMMATKPSCATAELAGHGHSGSHFWLLYTGTSQVF